MASPQFSFKFTKRPFWQGEKLMVTPEFEVIFNQAQEFLATNKASDK